MFVYKLNVNYYFYYTTKTVFNQQQLKGLFKRYHYFYTLFLHLITINRNPLHTLHHCLPQSFKCSSGVEELWVADGDRLIQFLHEQVAGRLALVEVQEHHNHFCHQVVHGIRAAQQLVNLHVCFLFK